eukprot:m.32997 g.32997  ORF g.32997 m.32997 type:complete len:347 (+) comp12494_c0_seq1:131-1171(+)
MSMPTTGTVPGVTTAMQQHDLSTLLGFCFAMFIGAFLAGYTPMCLTNGSGSTSTPAQSSRMRILTLFGAGLLTGTALIIIIPEGIEMWLSAQHEMHAAEVAAHTASATHESHDEHEHEHEHGHHHDHHWQIGAALASGFAFMLLVEKMSAGDGAGHGHAHVSVNEPSRTGSTGLELGGIGGLKSRDKKEGGSGKTSTAILGLIVHAAIDGVALGASTYSGNGRVSFIIFAAIMLHKAPAAFGLSVYLTSLGHHRRAVQQQLLIFSLAAPVGSIITFYGMYLNVLGVQLQQLALVMLFSGGTFLFVATVHIMPEVMKFDQTMSWSEVWATVIGIMIPIFLNVGEHGH